MKDFDKVVNAVNAYCERHGHTPKYTKSYPDDMYYYIEAMDYTTMEAEASGKKMVFKVDGKVTSFKK